MERGRGTGGPRDILILGWRILEYGGTRGFNQSCLRLMAAEDEGVHSSALDKRCLSVEARADKAEREAEEFILYLKLSVKAE